MRKKQKYIIWTSMPDFEDWKDVLKEQYPNASELELINMMHELNNDNYHDEVLNLSEATLERDILAIADIGLWYGRRSGYKVLKCEHLGECLRSFCSGYSDTEYYIDELGDFRMKEMHHDGINFVLFRVWKPNVSEVQKGNLVRKICEGACTRNDITRLTERVGIRVAQIYGWDIK